MKGFPSRSRLFKLDAMRTVLTWKLPVLEYSYSDTCCITSEFIHQFSSILSTVSTRSSDQSYTPAAAHCDTSLRWPGTDVAEGNRSREIRETRRLVAEKELDIVLAMKQNRK